MLCKCVTAIAKRDMGRLSTSISYTPGCCANMSQRSPKETWADCQHPYHIPWESYWQVLLHNSHPRQIIRNMYLLNILDISLQSCMLMTMGWGNIPNDKTPMVTYCTSVLYMRMQHNQKWLLNQYSSIYALNEWDTWQNCGRVSSHSLTWTSINSPLSGETYQSHMMTSSNGNIFRVTGPLCGEFTGPGEFRTQRPVTRSFDVFFDLRLNKPLSKQS